MYFIIHSFQDGNRKNMDMDIDKNGYKTVVRASAVTVFVGAVGSGQRCCRCGWATPEQNKATDTSDRLFVF